MRQFCTFILIVLVGGAGLQAQELSIGQIPFKLGMSPQEVKAKVHDPIYLDDPISQGGGMTVYQVREKHDDKYTLIGYIQFLNSKVFTISRDLGSFPSNEALEIGRVLFQGLDRLRSDDQNLPIQTTTHFASAVSGELSSITIGTGLRRISIAVPEPGKNSSMVIQEMLTSAPPPKKQ